MFSLLLLTVAVVDVVPNLFTSPMPNDADDPAIWVHPTSPARSLILGTDKAARVGGLFVFNLDGKIVQTIMPVDRPNNVDVEGNVAVLTERMTRRLRVFTIDPETGHLTDASGQTEVFAGELGDRGAPMGVGLYRRPSDGALFAIVSPKEGPAENYLGQYRLTLNPVTGKYDAALVRRFGTFSGKKEIESIAVDDALGFVYCSDETVGTRKYLADPDAPQANREVAFFNRTDVKGDHEGVGIWTRPDGTGYLVCTDQLPESSVYRVFRREGNNDYQGSFRLGADETDGIEVVSAPLGAGYPQGMMVAMNSVGRNFAVVDWSRIVRALDLK